MSEVETVAVPSGSWVKVGDVEVWQDSGRLVEVRVRPVEQKPARKAK